MRRKSLILALLVVMLLLGGVGATLVILVRHEPAYYARGAVPRGKQRYLWNRDFWDEFSHLYNTIQQQDDWNAQFTTEQINSYLQEDFVNSGVDEKMLPENISEPRVAIDADRLRLGFRYGYGRWSSIITIDMRLWVAQGEVNTVALELVGLQAGALPINAQSLLEHISDALRRSENPRVDVSWYRHEGHPVALLRFAPDQRRASVLLKHVALQDGRIIIQGSSAGTPATTTASRE